MKFFKKINIGLILAIITVVAVIVHCLIVEGERKKSKEDIKVACEDFINITNKYTQLPQEYQVINIKKSEIDLNGYYEKMQSELEARTITSKTAEIQKTLLSSNIDKQLLDTSRVMVEFDRQIVKIKSYDFSENQVTVVFSSRVKVKEKYNEPNMETEELTEKVKESSFDNEAESITLEKIDGKWKVVFADLQYSNPNTIMNLYM